MLAKKGVVAQTISSYGLHKDYHQPSDDLAHLDFEHMDAAIGSLVRADGVAGEFELSTDVECGRTTVVGNRTEHSAFSQRNGQCQNSVG